MPCQYQVTMYVIFTGPCQEITFSAWGICTDLAPLQKVKPHDCSRYYVCGGQKVYDCPCAPGTAMSSSTGICTSKYFAGNCTCPEQRTKATTGEKLRGQFVLYSEVIHYRLIKKKSINDIVAVT